MKKLLVSWNPSTKEPEHGQFVAPFDIDGNVVLVNIDSGQTVDLGLVVYTGVVVSPHDLFARIVESKVRIPNVRRCFSLLEYYLEQLHTVKIGTVLRLESDDKQLFRLSVNS